MCDNITYDYESIVEWVRDRNPDPIFNSSKTPEELNEIFWFAGVQIQAFLDEFGLDEDKPVDDVDPASVVAEGGYYKVEAVDGKIKTTLHDKRGVIDVERPPEKIYPATTRFERKKLKANWKVIYHSNFSDKVYTYHRTRVGARIAAWWGHYFEDYGLSAVYIQEM